MPRRPSGVLNAGIIAGTGDSDVLGIMPDGWAGPSQWVGALVFVGIILGVYRWVQARSSRSVVGEEQTTT